MSDTNSSAIMMENEPNTFSIRLLKRPPHGLGFIVRKRKTNPPVVISDLIPGGVAEQSCLVQVGDVLLAVNGVQLTDVPYNTALEVLRSVPMDSPCVLVLRGPDGFKTKLETLMSPDGLVQVIRLTEPEDHISRDRNQNLTPKKQPRKNGPRSPGHTANMSWPRNTHANVDSIANVYNQSHTHNGSVHYGVPASNRGRSTPEGSPYRYGRRSRRDTTRSPARNINSMPTSPMRSYNPIRDSSPSTCICRGHFMNTEPQQVLAWNGTFPRDVYNMRISPEEIYFDSPRTSIDYDLENERIVMNGVANHTPSVIGEPSELVTESIGTQWPEPIITAKNKGESSSDEWAKSENGITISGKANTGVANSGISQVDDVGGTHEQHVVDAEDKQRKVATRGDQTGTTITTSGIKEQEIANSVQSSRLPEGTMGAGCSTVPKTGVVSITPSSTETSTATINQVNLQHVGNDKQNGITVAQSETHGITDTPEKKPTIARQNAVNRQQTKETTTRNTTTTTTTGEMINGHSNGTTDSHDMVLEEQVIKQNGGLPITADNNMREVKLNDAGVQTDTSEVKQNGEVEEKESESDTSQGTHGAVCAREKSKQKYVRVTNLIDGKQFTDTLHQKTYIKTLCDETRCFGSIMFPPKGKGRSKDEVLLQAKDFIRQYFTHIKRADTPAHKKRWDEVESSIEQKGIYDLTEMELIFGAKTAWRNAPRCIGRIQWTKLQVFDARNATTAHDMYHAICNHMGYATNKGNLRSAITIFPPRTDGEHDFRVWNPQLIRYACYKQPDGKLIGDPANLEFTEVCQKLGWKGSGGAWDILPLVLQANGQDPEVYDIPQELILEVHMSHPNYDWFADLGLRWYALPAVSCIMLDLGGLQFTGIPFNGWYMETEIGARDFCDENRLNMCETIARKMGLDVSTNATLWKDKAVVEANVAVMHSFQKANVTITDHHSASESFLKHMENEQRLRGGCPADWVWIVPPISGSITPVFHQEMLSYNLKPSYEYQEEPWRTHVFKTAEEGQKKKRRKLLTFKEVAKAVKFSAKLMGKALAKRIKATILYASETGRSEKYAKVLCEIFKHAFDAKVLCMEDYDPVHLEHETLLLVVTSTFGNGDPPENGEEFGRFLMELRRDHTGSEDRVFTDMLTRREYIWNLVKKRRFPKDSKALRFDKFASEDREEKAVSKRASANLDSSSGPLANVRYSIFGLGSSAYPNFCAFAKAVDSLIADMDGERIQALGEGDELSGQEESFRTWAKAVFKAACETFCVGKDVNMQEANASLQTNELSWAPDKFRLVPEESGTAMELCEALTKLHTKRVLPCLLMSSNDLQSDESTRSTIQVTMDTQGASELLFEPGDHVAICPANEKALVDAILARVKNERTPDEVVVVQVLQQRSTPLGVVKAWNPTERLPPCSMRQALEYYVDITTPPSPDFLRLLSLQATDPKEQEKLTLLGKGSSAYEDWKYENSPNLIEVLNEFSSINLSIEFLLQEAPLLKPRYYSISSSPRMYPGEIHATVAVVCWRTKGGKGPLHNGVCSSWLNRLKPGEVIPAFIRQAPLFRLPEKRNLPCILVGPGTGIAPFRSFWQQRQIDLQFTSAVNEKGEKVLGDISMFFGCRHPDLDNIYAEEKQKAITDGALREVHIAYSREPEQPKKYVQHVLKDQAREVFRTLDQDNGHFFVCGDVSMAGDVQKALEEIISDQGKMSIDQAKEYVSKLRDHTRYHEDIFGVTLKTAEVRSKLRTAVRAHVLISAGGSKLTPAGEALQADQNENGQDGPNKELERSNSVKSLGDKEKRESP
ncbi:nitric oxide synthase-like protein isoform X4 [Apostichopus japonicus]|uniref:nitric oxide synthase-like protein isoform X4 n=1 Tax=Stichopus japonicus TaxID=307972 RepID=UPI003AB81DC0